VQVLADPAVHVSCPLCRRTEAAGRPIAAYIEALKGIHIVRRAVEQYSTEVQDPLTSMYRGVPPVHDQHSGVTSSPQYPSIPMPEPSMPNVRAAVPPHSTDSAALLTMLCPNMRPAPMQSQTGIMTAPPVDISCEQPSNAICNSVAEHAHTQPDQLQYSPGEIRCCS
jgi:hypothetical protein